MGVQVREDPERGRQAPLSPFPKSTYACPCIEVSCWEPGGSRGMGVYLRRETFLVMNSEH